ncbi:MAG: hypothetical protein JWQ14_61 [Adhaeribacter sp.]|nr:hypothetical protein [Adhaeribacter sp.]
MGKIIILVGLGIALLGLIIWLSGDKLNWFGHLPGDIRVERPNFKFYAPIVSMLLLSIFISLVLWIIRRFF